MKTHFNRILSSILAFTSISIIYAQSQSTADELIPICQDISITLAADGTASIAAEQLDFGSTGGSGALYFSVDQADFDCSHLGSNAVLLTISDDNGNVATCEASVTVASINSSFEYIESSSLLASSASSSDLFGSSVAMSQNRSIVGAAYDDDEGTDAGCAYIYEWDGISWVEQKITGADGAAWDYFGFSVAISGDRAIVGAPSADNSSSDAGSAYIFRWDGSTWLQEQKLMASDASAYDYFGFSVSISGNRALVSATGDDDNGSLSGSAYIFEWDGLNWVESSKLTAYDGNLYDKFGHSVAIWKDHIIVGAYHDDDGGLNSGSAYVYNWNGTSWVDLPKLTASDAGSNNFFGNSVDILENRVLVGAYRNMDGNATSGSAYIYDWDGSMWIEQKLVPSDAADNDEFGYSVALSKNRAIIGARFDDDNGPNSGSAYVYDWDGSSWEEIEKLTAAAGAVGDQFGYQVGLSGNQKLIGARYDDDGALNAGGAFVYDLTYTELPFTTSCSDISVEISANGTVNIAAELLNNDNFGGCGGYSYSADQILFDCSHLGSNTVNLTATDDHGNTATCTSNVLIEKGDLILKGGDLSLPIENGDLSPDIDNGTDFGIQAAQTYTIDNSANSINLNIASVTLSDNLNFQLVSYPAIIGPYGLSTFEILCTPTNLGPHYSTITVSLSDCHYNDFVFDIVAGTAPEVCFPEYTLTGPIDSEVYQASGLIQSNSILPIYTIAEFRASEIELQAGFEVVQGAEFDAIIDPCSNVNPIDADDNSAE